MTKKPQNLKPPAIFSGRLSVLSAILLLAFLLRLWGIHFGLPDLYHADEPVIVNHALAYGNGDFNPHFFKIPPLTSYLLFVCYGLFYLFGGFSDIESFKELFFHNPTIFYLIARILFGAVLGTVTIWAWFRIIHKHFGHERALLTAFFLALAFLHVRDSHYIYADIPMQFFLLLSIGALLDVSKETRLRSLFRFSIFSAISIAFKYNAVFVYIPYLIFCIYALTKNKSLSLKYLLILPFIIVPIFFAILNPYAVIDYAFFIKEIYRQSEAAGYAGPWHHLCYSLAEGIGWPLSLLALLGIVISLLRLEINKLLLSSFFIGYYFILIFKSQLYDRYALPLLPFALFFSAEAVIYLRDRFRIRMIYIYFIAFSLTLPSLIKIIKVDWILTQPDARDLAREWIESHIPENSKIALDSPFFLPRIKHSTRALQEKIEKSESLHLSHTQRERLKSLIHYQKMGRVKGYQIYHLADLNSAHSALLAQPDLPFDIGALRRNAINYVIISKISPNHHWQFHKDLERHAKLIGRWSPYKTVEQKWAIDPIPMTGAPTLLSELSARNHNGQIIELYQLNKISA